MDVHFLCWFVNLSKRFFVKGVLIMFYFHKPLESESVEIEDAELLSLAKIPISIIKVSLYVK